ncbi:UMP kinase [Candidatus Actinomarina sp.]|jgi:uridylate kinase|nr:UMP kinase [Acidimicrobiia bacterium]MDA7850633.1 UMP kinase [Acidimicrobiaceae bacterium]MDA8710181.1 UMP kinase [Candidatus Actinomarina sp.]MDA7594779.1 UMP kinase [Acidimicrobiia bacterium]MDA8964327.1 UMP kinase [Acidimicrobiia bacterium]|tara:strand:- start:1255 stop:1959 length:705 start_codon:yes stop_codon:yes gene_type:complete
MSKRVLLKLSGESFADSETNFGISPNILTNIANQISKANEEGIQIAVVVGGGNFFRGVQESAKGMAQANADYMGMLATVINAVALKDALDKNGTQTRVQSAITMTAVAEPYIRLKAIRHLEKGRIVIFAAGTGNPYFTTDTAASLRAAEIDADIVLKSTRVEGVYSSDPEINENAELYSQISYKDVISKKLGVMDLTAITLCEENKMPIRVFDGTQNNNIYNVLTGNELGTLIN